MQTGMAGHTRKRVILILLGLTALVAAYVYWLKPQSSSISPVSGSPSEQDLALSHALNECDGITEKAALALPPAIVEFQRLEHAGRKARVLRLCMHDRGYQESQRWTEYAQPLAGQVANVSQISVDEAMENLSRVAMVRAQPEADAPSYWAKR